MQKTAHFEILNPPTKYILVKKRKTNETIYLTNNVFYGGVHHWSVQRKVINFAKDFLILFLYNIPKMNKMRLEVVYFAPESQFDLDNKGGFWVKMLLDLLKTPSMYYNFNFMRPFFVLHNYFIYVFTRIIGYY